MASILNELARPAAPALPDEPAWNEAFLRVENYLHAHHLESRVLLNQLATEIIRSAHAQSQLTPGVAPVTLALQVAHVRIGAWFARAGQRGDWTDERVRTRGRLALLLADLPGRWVQDFLAPTPVPAELVAALHSGVLQPGPELHFRNMPTAPLDFHFTGENNPPSLGPGGWTSGRAAFGWLALVGLLGAAWVAGH